MPSWPASRNPPRESRPEANFPCGRKLAVENLRGGDPSHDRPRQLGRILLAGAGIGRPPREDTMRWLLAPLVLVGSVACHDARSPLSPTTPEQPSGPLQAGTSASSSGKAPAPKEEPPGPLTFVSGETQQPVAGAHVVLAGKVYLTDDSGRVFVDATASALDVEAPGFLLRQALLAPTRFTLWPRVSPTGLDEEATGRMVYGCNATGCPTGGDPLVRLATRTAVIVPSTVLMADEQAREALEEGARLLTAATEGAVTLRVSATPQPGAATVT